MCFDQSHHGSCFGDASPRPAAGAAPLGAPSRVGAEPVACMHAHAGGRLVLAGGPGRSVSLGRRRPGLPPAGLEPGPLALHEPMAPATPLHELVDQVARDHKLNRFDHIK